MGHGPHTFVMRMAGTSMAPRFRDGDYLYVDPDEPVETGRFVAIDDPETSERTVRLLVKTDGRRLLRALCCEGPDRILDAGNESMVLGVVVFVGSAV